MNLFNKPFERIYQYEQEYWVKINDRMVPNIKPYYWISNMGRVYSEFNDSILCQQLDYRGYCVINLRLNNNKNKLSKVHRLVALGFILCIGNPDLFQVNHKDGNKLNNKFWNLEWSTAYDNVHHAMDTGLRKSYGENVHTAILNNDIVVQISELLLQNKSYKEIIYILNLPDNAQSIRRLERIRTKETWKNITSNYDFSNYDPYYNIRIFTDEEIHKICKYFEKFGIDSSISNIMNYINKEYDSLDSYQKAKFSSAIGKIRRRERFKQISKLYNF